MRLAAARNDIASRSEDMARLRARIHREDSLSSTQA
jgi:hypothetical protein